MTEQPDATFYDAPNQQAVRADQSPPWQEGTGGGEPSAPNGGDAYSDAYSGMTKAELIDTARDRGISPANADMTKDELSAALRAADQAA